MKSTCFIFGLTPFKDKQKLQEHATSARPLTFASCCPFYLGALQPLHLATSCLSLARCQLLSDYFLFLLFPLPVTPPLCFKHTQLRPCIWVCRLCKQLEDRDSTQIIPVSPASTQGHHLAGEGGREGRKEGRRKRRKKRGRKERGEGGRVEGKEELSFFLSPPPILGTNSFAKLKS